MTHFDRLLACAGTWRGTNRVQPGRSEAVNESLSSIEITPIINRTFLRIDQTWRWEQTPQSGSFLIGYNPANQATSIHWVDAWHNGTRVMPLTGTFNEAGTLVAHGHFPNTDTEDWGWRIEIKASDDEFQINMFCINPNSNQEDGGVWSTFKRST